MEYVKIIIVLLVFFFSVQTGLGQPNPGVIKNKGIVVDQSFQPIENVHIINFRTGAISITDSTGFFSLKVQENDSLFVSSLAHHDTLLIVVFPEKFQIISLVPEKYHIGEVKVFEWGSTYQDFREAFLDLEIEQLGEKLGLPVQDPDVVPFYLDEAQLKSPAFAINSPISFLYYNFSKKEKSARKVYRLNRDKELWDKYFSIFNKENVHEITGLEGEDLEKFWLYLNQEFECTPSCSEYEILSEISRHLTNFRVQVVNPSR